VEGGDKRGQGSFFFTDTAKTVLSLPEHGEGLNLILCAVALLCGFFRGYPE
jgi:hypothetical protein